MKWHFGIAGLLVGVVAVGIAIFQDDLRAAQTKPKDPVAPPEAVETEESLKDLAFEAGKKMLKEKLLEKAGRAMPSPPIEESEPTKGLGALHDDVALAYTGLGFVAMILGVVSWIRKDCVRISGGAVALGLMAIAWEFVLIGVGIAIVVFILANLYA